MFEPALYVVATPIGNLGDASPRMGQILAAADFVFAEDTRTSGLLCHKLGITVKKFVSFTDASGLETLRNRAQLAVDAIKQGKIVAIVSDAGTPGISDPGDILVSLVRKAGLPVVSVPGPSALTAALSIAGLGISHPLFYGFLPHKKGRQTAVRRFKELLDEGFIDAVVLYESPHRLVKLLNELWPEARVLVAREITKKFEEVRLGLPSELLLWAEKAKGEMVVIITRSL